jgi:hypothetical protein
LVLENTKNQYHYCIVYLDDNAIKRAIWPFSLGFSTNKKVNPNMVNILIISKAGSLAFKRVNIIPRIGEKVGMFYQQYPTIVDIIWYPNSEVLERVGFSNNDDIEAIIAVE